MFCQLETLRHCLPPSVWCTLDELPESLDETYERILKEIKKPNRVHARRLLQCLVVAVRPLGVEELAEVLAVDFDDAEGIPKLNPNWRWEDQEQALLSSCSSLVTIVKSFGSRIAQFSHFSVKEFMTSARLATSSDVSSYYIALEPAHTILAQACMSILLRSDGGVQQGDVRHNSPLARYAAAHWVAHAQYQKVSSCLRKAMEYLFDLDKPYFAAWLQLHDIDTFPHSRSTFSEFTPYSKSDATPLYYAALCGFQDLVEWLIANKSEHVNASGGYYVAPLVAALAEGHSQTAKLLRDNGANPNVRGLNGTTPLHSAAFYGEFEIVRILLDFGANVNARNTHGKTPLHLSSQGWGMKDPRISQSLSNVAKLLLDRGADRYARENDRIIPLHLAAQYERVEVVRVLLEHGTNVDGEEDDHEIAESVNARDAEGKTPLHFVSERTWEDPEPGQPSSIVQLLLKHGADLNARSIYGLTPLHAAALYGMVNVVRVLLEHGANVGVEDNEVLPRSRLRRIWNTKKLCGCCRAGTAG